MTCKDIDKSYDMFAAKYNQVFDKCFSLIRISFKRYKDKKWTTKSMILSIINKTRLYKKYTNKPNYNNKILYRQYKNKLTSIIRYADNSYYSKLLLQAKHSTRDLLKIYAGLNNKGETEHYQC